MIKRISRVLTAVGAVGALMVLTGQPASADPAPVSQQHAKAMTPLTMGGTAAGLALNDTVTCNGFVNKPNYSGSIITGTAGISSCTPHAATACASETTLQIYMTGPGLWEAAGPDERQTACPPPARSTSSSVACEPASSTWSYRTEVIVTCIYGTTVVTPGWSDVLNVKCV